MSVSIALLPAVWSDSLNFLGTQEFQGLAPLVDILVALNVEYIAIIRL